MKQIFLWVLVLLAGSAQPASLKAAQKGAFLLVSEKGDSGGIKKSKLKKKKKSRKKRKVRKKRKKIPREAYGQQEKTSSNWFPSFAPYGFSFELDPIFGLNTISSKQGDIKKTGFTSESGLSLSLNHIPLIKNHFYFSPSAGMTKGHTSYIQESPSERSEFSSNFSRVFGGPGFDFLAGSWRYKLRVAMASLDYDSKDFFDTKSLRVVNEVAIKLLKPWSLVLTASNLRLWQQEYQNPFLKEADLWFHSQFYVSWQNIFIDLGPGFTYLTHPLLEASSGKHQSAESSYFLGLVGMDFFWKIKGTIKGRYIFSSKKELDDTYADLVMPDQNVSSQASLASMPEDSYEQTITIGAQNILGGFGLIWNYHKVVYNASDKKGASFTKEDSGYQLTYQLGLL